MKNTIAIGIPDKVSRAERDGVYEQVLRKVPESVKRKVDKKIKQLAPRGC